MNHDHSSRNTPPVPYLEHELADTREHLHLEELTEPPRDATYAAWRHRMTQKEQQNAPRNRAHEPEQPPMQKYPLQQLTAGQAFAGYAGAYLLRPIIALLQPLATALALALIATAAYAVYLNFAKITAWLTW